MGIKGRRKAGWGIKVMAKKEDIYKKALEGKRIPILTLDNKWYRLFNMMEPDKELKKLEDNLNSLLKLQGKLNTESKGVKKIKKNLMDEIVQLMECNDSASEKKIEENKRLIEECNEKLDEYKLLMSDPMEKYFQRFFGRDNERFLHESRQVWAFACLRGEHIEDMLERNGFN